MTVTAFIRVKKYKSKTANVRFRLRDGRDFQLYYKSEFSVIPDKWDENQQKIKARCIIDESERVAFDDGINERKSLIKSIYLSAGKKLTKESLKCEIDKVLYPKNKLLANEVKHMLDQIDKLNMEQINVLLDKVLLVKNGYFATNT